MRRTRKLQRAALRAINFTFIALATAAATGLCAGLIQPFFTP